MGSNVPSATNWEWKSHARQKAVIHTFYRITARFALLGVKTIWTAKSDSALLNFAGAIVICDGLSRPTLFRSIFQQRFHEDKSSTVRHGVRELLSLIDIRKADGV